MQTILIVPGHRFSRRMRYAIDKVPIRSCVKPTRWHLTIVVNLLELMRFGCDSARLTIDTLRGRNMRAEWRSLTMPRHGAPALGRSMCLDHGNLLCPHQAFKPVGCTQNQGTTSTGSRAVLCIEALR